MIGPVFGAEHVAMDISGIGKEERDCVGYRAFLWVFAISQEL